MYHLTAYYAARTLLFLPFEIIPLLFNIITYWMAGLNPYFGRFVLFSLVLILDTMVASSLGLAIGTFAETVVQAIGIAAVVQLLSVMVVHFLVLSPPAWISWTQYLSFSTYVFKVRRTPWHESVTLPYCFRASEWVSKWRVDGLSGAASFHRPIAKPQRFPCSACSLSPAALLWRVETYCMSPVAPPFSSASQLLVNIAFPLKPCYTDPNDPTCKYVQEVDLGPQLTLWAGHGWLEAVVLVVLLVFFRLLALFIMRIRLSSGQRKFKVA